MKGLMSRALEALCAFGMATVSVAQPTVTSNFDANLDGWNAVGFEVEFGLPPPVTRVVNSADIVHSATAGNPGGYARLTDSVIDPGSFASAPAKFLGDLSNYKNVGGLSFDHKLFSTGTPNSGIQSYNAFIVSGNPNNYNFLLWEGAPAPAGANDWVHFDIPLDEAHWSPFILASMTFDQILANVTEILLPFELVDNDGTQNQEHTGIDNVVLAVSSSRLAGDFSDNGSVENADLTLLLNNWAKTVPPTPAGWNGPPPTAPAVDNDELTALLNNWGKTAGVGSVTAGLVPEPAAAALLIFGAAMLVIGCRQPKRG